MATRHHVLGAPPAPTTALVGRRREADRLRQLLGQSRVVTLTGPPGVGKTRLALRVAAEATRRFSDGAWIVDLAGLRDPGLLANEIAAALGLVDATTRWAVEGLVEHLDGRRASRAGSAPNSMPTIWPSAPNPASWWQPSSP